jgi:hypothetical protein
MASALRYPSPAPDKRRPAGAVDQGALILMLSYVEAECLRLGAADSAHHAAMAAALLPGPVTQPLASRAKLS